MAARNPTDWNRWVKKLRFTAGRPIMDAEPDRVLDDMEYTLDAERLILSDFFVPQGTVGDDTTVRVYHLMTKDMCAAADIAGGEFAHEWCAYVWVSAADTSMNVKLISTVAADTDTQAVGFLEASPLPIWKGWGSIDIETNDVEETLTLQIKRTAGTGTVYVAGLGVFAVET